MLDEAQAELAPDDREHDFRSLAVAGGVEITTAEYKAFKRPQMLSAKS